MTQKELYDKYLWDLKILQAECKHEIISEWMDECWAPAHYSGFQVRCCESCGAQVERRSHWNWPEGIITITE